MQVSFYDFYGCKVVEDRPPLLEMNLYSSAEGFIEIITPGILSDYTIEAEVYKLIAPTYTDPRFFKTGEDLISDEVLFTSHELLTNGNLRIFYRFNPYPISGSENDDYYGVTFFVNKLRNAQYVKVSADVVFHIVNKFEDA